MAVGRGQRHAGIGDDADVRDRQIFAQERVVAGVLDDQRLAGGSDVLAERMGERGLSLAGPGFGQALLALEKLPVPFDQRDERNRHPQHPGHDGGDVIEEFLARAVEQPALVQGRQPAVVRSGNNGGRRAGIILGCSAVGTKRKGHRKAHQAGGQATHRGARRPAQGARCRKLRQGKNRADARSPRPAQRRRPAAARGANLTAPGR